MSVISRFSPSRDRIYQVLVGAPDDSWTVRSLTDEIARHPGQVSADAVRVTLYLLAQARIASESWREGSLTFTLTPNGVNQLQGILRSWTPADRPSSMRMAS
jgi:hypothetical protein